jgi:peptidoglycan hydrolase-like protein with peptidoglycan-binding domain
VPYFDNQDKGPAWFRAGARASVLLAAGAGIAAGASLTAPQAATAAKAGSPLGIAAHKRSSHHSASRHHSAPVLSPELLSVGDRGAAVSQVQRALHRHTTGYFGSGTRKAVTRFQRRHHLTNDGVVGPQTRRAMHLRVRIIAPPASAPVPASTTTSTPAPAPAGSSTSSSSTQPTATQSTSGGGYAIPSQVVQCESGGNPSAVSPYSGGGLYGILDSSWQAFGGTAYAPHPYDASPSQQGAIANKILASQGPGAWQCWK